MNEYKKKFLQMKKVVRRFLCNTINRDTFITKWYEICEDGWTTPLKKHKKSGPKKKGVENDK